MHGYIYDTFLTQKSFEKDLIRIENRLTDLGLKGQIIRLSVINNVRHAVDELLRNGVTTIVSVGSDQLFSKILDFAPKLNNITVGLIPLGEHQQMANILGIPEGVQACPVISARLTQSVPLAKINHSYFLHSAVIQDPRARIRCEQQFVASPTTNQAVTSILNQSLYSQSDSLSILIEPKSRKKFLQKQSTLQPSQIQAEHIMIDYPPGAQIIIDGQKILTTPAQFEPASQNITVIVGKSRKI